MAPSPGLLRGFLAPENFKIRNSNWLIYFLLWQIKCTYLSLSWGLFSSFKLTDSFVEWVSVMGMNCNCCTRLVLEFSYRTPSDLYSVPPSFPYLGSLGPFGIVLWERYSVLTGLEKMNFILILFFDRCWTFHKTPPRGGTTHHFDPTVE